MLITPIAGAVGGGTAVRSSSSLSTIGAIIIGILVGIGLIVGFRWLIRTIPEGTNIMQKRYDWLAVLTLFFIIPLGFPIVTFVLSQLIVGRLLHL